MNKHDIMKILWFTNTPSMAEQILSDKPVGGGWIKSLECELKKKKNIKLGIAFYHDKDIEDFEFKNTNYFPIFKKRKSKINKYISRYNGQIEPKSEVSLFLRIVKDFNPDIIHIHGTEGPFGLIQKNISNIPIFISIQGCLTVYSYKYFSGLTRGMITKYSYLKSLILFKDYASTYQLFSNKSKREIEILKMSKNIIGRTDWDRRISSILAPKSKYFHNDEILRDSFYKKIWYKGISKNFQLFTTSGTNVFKGLEVILLTADLLDSIGFDYTWNVAGLLITDEIVGLTSRVIGKKPSKNLVFQGVMSEDELVARLLDSNTYIMPSHIENSPNNLCEAMILGVPCIASDAGGTSSLLTNNIDGILIQDGDPWSLAGAIVEMKENYKRGIEYGINARDKALKRHDPGRIVNELIDHYLHI